MQIDFAKVVQNHAESLARELKTDELLDIFTKTYLTQETFELNDYQIQNKGLEVSFDGQISMGADVLTIIGQGNGAWSAFIDGLIKATGREIHITNYSEHAIHVKPTKATKSLPNDEPNNNQTNSEAAAYVQLNINGQMYSGIGVCNSTVSAMLKGVLSALSQAW